MKKTLSLILSALLVAGMSVATMAWEKGVDYCVIEEVDPDNMGDAYGDMYPGSLDWDWAECTSGQLLKGTVIAGTDGTSHCWSNGTDNAAKAFDGDTSTFFDPYAANTDSWCGMILDQPYELTEIRIMPRESWLARMVGAAVQGSNDGTNWVDIIYITGITEAPAGYDYHVFTPQTNDEYVAYYADYGIEQPDFSTYWVGSGSYQYYRYVNLEAVHGDLADIELYGNPAPATEVSADMINTTVIYTSDLENFYEEVENTGTAAVVTEGSIEGTVIGGGGAYADTASYACAFDGDAATFYDPKTAGPKCFTGIQTAEPYALTEVKIMPRADQYARTEGATIQGSNDGATWTTLAAYTIDDCLAAEAEQTWISKTITDTNGYTMFRYVSDGTQHGDVAEVAFYGAPAAAAPAATTEAPAAEAAPEGETIDYAHYVASANDPYFAYENTIDIDPEVVTWAQIKYRTITEKDSLDNTLTGQIYITPAAEPFIPVKWNHTGNWETIVVDLTSVSEKTTLTSLWKDSLGLGFRLDPMESNRDAEANTGDDPAAVLPDSAIDVAYVAFFETEEAAKAFDGVNGAVALVDAAMLAAPSAATNGAVELLTETVAAPVVEEEPVVEETPVEEPAAEEVVEEAPVEEEVVEEPAEEVVEEVVDAPAAEEVVEEAPQTFDAGIIAAIAAIASAAGYALSKKRR